MKFHPRRPTISAAQFDGSTESLNSILLLVDASTAPAYTITNGENGPVLSIGVIPGAPDWTMNVGDWFVSTPEQFGRTSRMMDNHEFTRTFEPAESLKDQSNRKAAAEAAKVGQPSQIDMQVLQLRGTALEAALRLSTTNDSADNVVKEDELFKHYLTGSNPESAAEHDKTVQAASHGDMRFAPSAYNPYPEKK